MEIIINDILQNQIKIIQNQKPEIHKIETPIDFSNISEQNFKNGIRVNMKSLHSKLNEIKESSIYIFNINSNISYESIIEKYNNFPNKYNLKLPPLKQKADKKSRVLYIGKREGGYRKKHDYSFLAGRINHHLGFFINKKDELVTTSSLQLFHWAKDLDLKLSLQIITFDGNIKYQLGAIEKEIALVKKPIIGSH